MLEKSERARRVMKSNSLFCFWHKKGKSRVKRTVLKFSLQLTLLKKRITLRYFALRSSLFCSSLFAPTATRAKEQRANSQPCKSIATLSSYVHKKI